MRTALGPLLPLQGANDVDVGVEQADRRYGTVGDAALPPPFPQQVLDPEDRRLVLVVTDQPDRESRIRQPRHRSLLVSR